MAQSDVKIFWIKITATAEDEIRAWMRENRSGYYLTHPDDEKMIQLHQVECDHAGGPESTLPLANYKKVCSPYPQDLIEWTQERFSKEPRRCHRRICNP